MTFCNETNLEWNKKITKLTYAENLISKSKDRIHVGVLNTILSNLNDIDINNAKTILSTQMGLYFWCDKLTSEFVYIGIAIGKKGLKQRLVLQHLNPNYLEYRIEKHTHKDVFQLDNAVVKLTKSGVVKHGIDKSSFRKAIGRLLYLTPGLATCRYIEDNLTLRVFEHHDKNYLRDLEKELIQTLKPKFNTSYK